MLTILTRAGAMVSPAVSANTNPRQAVAPITHAHGFHLLLSEFNPLQYIPVVGTIYRAITHDTIPEPARIAGSLVVSGLTGGPIGVALNLGITAIEKLAGVDPERIGQSVVTSLFHPAQATPPHALAAATPSPLAFSSAQIAAYRAHTPGTQTTSDVLNTMELARLA